MALHKVPQHRGTIFVGGLLVGAIVGAGVLLGVRQPVPDGRPVAAQQPAPAVASQSSPNCGFAPVLAPGARGDGLFALPGDARDATAADAAAYVAVGRDAAGQGRVRDAEVAFIASCRMAGPGDSVELAEAKYQLASHYVTVAASDAAARGEALARAKALMSDSVALYGARLGLDDEKTRLAAAGLAGVERATAPPEQPLGVPRVLLAERALYDSMVPQPAASRVARAPRDTREARDGSAPEPETTAMGGPPAVKKEPVRPRPRPRPAEPADDAAAAIPPGCPDGDCGAPAAASGEAQARPQLPRAEESGETGGPP